jgi:hypothetical protein
MTENIPIKVITLKMPVQSIFLQGGFCKPLIEVPVDLSNITKKIMRLINK